MLAAKLNILPRPREAGERVGVRGLSGSTAPGRRRWNWLMRVECVSRIDEVRAGTPGVIVLPEYSDLTQVNLISRAFPEAIVVAAIEQGGRSRAALFHQGKNRVNYSKIGSDGRTRGVNELPPSLPVYELPQICIGMLICMDVQCGQFVHAVIEQLERHPAAIKLLCIPAFMGAEWFSGETVAAPFNRVHVALSNSTVQDRPRCKSFISDASGTKLRLQIGHEPIAWSEW